MAFAVALLGSSSASASTVAIRAIPGAPAGIGELVLVGGPGERNEIVLRFVADVANPMGGHWMASDAGAALVPGDGCGAIDPHTVRCPPSAGFPGAPARVELGDMDDALVLEGGLGTVDGGPGDDRVVGAAMLFGGPGDDDLVGHPLGHPASFGNLIDGGPGDDRLVGRAGSDELHGGGGIDELIGGESNDRLYDDDALAQTSPGPDRFDGGPGADLVSYEQRTGPVLVNLADPAPDGERGEGDQLVDIEAITGGRGDDRLTGDDGPNTLDGGRGRDRLSGRGGADELLRAEGPVFCGGDNDTYRGGRSSRDLLQPDCELLAPDHNSSIGANPIGVSRRVVRFFVRCPGSEDEESLAAYEICGPGTLRLREAQGRRRVLASGRLPVGRWSGRDVNVRLTALGRRLAGRRHGVTASVRFGGYYPGGRSLRWSIQLAVPR